MYKLKKIFALFLAIVLATSFSTVAFAAESETGIPENATKHTIEVTLEPGESANESENGITPYIWNNEKHTLPSGSVTYTLQFNVPERYFAFEASALTDSGTSCSGTYSVTFVRSVNSPIAGTGAQSVNGSSTKVDWITIDDTSASNYHFKITNNTSYNITVSIVYYSWS